MRFVIEMPNAKRLIHDDDVRVAGVTVGRIEAVHVVPQHDGQRAHVRVQVALRRSDVPLTTRTLARVRTNSALGSNYIQLVVRPGGSPLNNGGILPLSNARDVVEATDLFSIFDRATRAHARTTFQELGTGLAGRGPLLNEAFEQLNDLLPPLSHVSARLADPASEVAPVLARYARFASDLASVRGRVGHLVAVADTTFTATAHSRAGLAGILGRLPRAELATTQALTRLNSPLHELNALIVDLGPGTQELPSTLARARNALAAGILPLTRVPPFAHAVDTTSQLVRSVVSRRATDGTVRKLDQLVRTARPLISDLEAAQLNCNVISPMLRNFADLTTGFGVGEGPPLAAFSLAFAGAQGEILQQPRPSPNAAINYTPIENANECEAGNELHDGVTQRLGNVPGNQGKMHPDTVAPADSRERARGAGLLTPPIGGSR